MARGFALKIGAVLAGLVLIWPLAVHDDAGAWGFFGHKRINRMACFTLPPAMFGFYKRHIDFISDHAPDPDRRRYAVPEEAARHYIDIDHYVKPGEDPFTVVPRTWDMAVAKFTEDTLQAYGIVPWHIPGDAHVPLHTTENYNGQLTNQHGIHAFWESRIPELSADAHYDHLVGRATYMDDPLGAAWAAV